MPNNEQPTTSEDVKRRLSAKAKANANVMRSDEMGGEVGWGRMIVRVHMLTLAEGGDEDLVAELICKAQAGDPEADAILCGAAYYHLSRGDQMPANLQRYICEKILRPRFAILGKRRRGRQTNWFRAYFIVNAIDELRRVGVSPTRNAATQDKESGCSVVAELLKEVGIYIEERGVEEVWHDHRKMGLRTPSGPA